MKKGKISRLRRLTAFLMAVLMSLTLIPVETAMAAGIQTGKCGMNLTWTYEPVEEVLTIDGTGSMLEFYDGAPWEDFYIKHIRIGDGVTSLSRCAFNNRIRLVDVSFGAGLEVIGEYAFADCPNLKTVHLPEKLKDIGSAAFSNCSNLANVELGGAVTIGDYAFYGCADLKNIRLPDTVQTIGLEAFSDCTSLMKISLPESVKTLKESAFAGCTSLMDITLGHGVQAVGKDAFIRTAWYDKHGDGLLYLGDWLIGYKGNMDINQPLVVEDGIRCIADGALADYAEMKNLILPKTVESIGDGALARCTAMESIDLPQSVTMLGWNAFSGCSNLKDVTLGSIVDLYSGVFAGCSTLRELIIPGSVAYIHPDVFLGCSSLERIVFQGDAPAIWWGAFRDVKAEVEYPSGNETWTDENRQGFGGTLTWVSSATPPVVDPLPAPEAHLLSDSVTGKPVLSWDNVLGAEAYHIYVRNTPEEAYEYVCTTEELSYTNLDAVPGTHYYYQVCAVSADGTEGAFSSEKHRTCDCAQPQAMISNNQEGKPVVTWSRVPGAVKYQVYRSVEGGEYSRLFTTEGLRMTNGTAETGKTYSYQVVAVASNSYGNSVPSEPVTAMCLPAAPAAIAETNPASGKPSLTWEALDGVAKYEIRCRRENSSDWDMQIATAETQFVVEEAVPGECWQFQARAVLEDGSFGVWSDVATCCCICAQPVVTISYREDGKPIVSWEKIPGADRYEVYRSVYGGESKLLLTTRGNHMSNGSARTGLYYSYQVKAVAADERNSSVLSEVTVAQCLLGAPVFRLGVKSSSGKPVLSWDPVDGAENYEVWRKEGKDGTYKLLTIAHGTRLTNTSAKPGISYYYQIRPMSEDIPGVYSVEKHVTCDCARPNVQLSRRNNHPYLSWKSVDGAIKYEVWCSKDGGEEKLLATVRGTHLTNNSAKKGHTYRYRVRAICQNKYGNSAYSQSDTIKL